jgi:hypothetical protein
MPKEKLQEAWRLWRDQWGVGGVDVQIRDIFQSRTHAIHYITKYLMKPQVWPAWFLAGSRQRMVQGSRKVGRLVMAEYESSSVSLRTRRVNRVQTLDVRVAMCDQVTDVFISRVNPDTWEERLQYYGRFPGKMDDILRLCEERQVPGIAVRAQEHFEVGYKAVRHYLAMSPNHTGASVFGAVFDYLHCGPGHVEREDGVWARVEFVREHYPEFMEERRREAEKAKNRETEVWYGEPWVSDEAAPF